MMVTKIKSNIGIFLNFRSLNFVISLSGTLGKTMMWFLVYKLISIEDIGGVNTITSFASYTSFILGLETHRIINRKFILENGSNLFLKERFILACLLNGIITVTLYQSFGSIFDRIPLIVTFGYFISEYLAVELSRIKCATEKFISPALANNCCNLLSVIVIYYCLRTNPLLGIAGMASVLAIVSSIKTFWLLLSSRSIIINNLNSFDDSVLKNRKSFTDLLVSSNSFIVIILLEMIPNFLDRYLVKFYFGLKYLGIFNMYFGLLGFAIMFFDSYLLTPNARVLKEFVSVDSFGYYKRYVFKIILIALAFYLFLFTTGLYVFNWLNKPFMYDKSFILAYALLATMTMFKSINYFFIYANGQESFYRNLLLIIMPIHYLIVYSIQNLFQLEFSTYLYVNILLIFSINILLSLKIRKLIPNVKA